MFCSAESDTRRWLDQQARDDAAKAMRYADHLEEAREALTRNTGKAIRHWLARQPKIAAFELYSDLTEKQQEAIADIVSRAALAGDQQAVGLIDQLAMGHADLCSEGV